MMIHDVVKAEYKADYKIQLVFDDGKAGLVDFSKFIAKGGVFKKLKDYEFFKNFNINKDLGVISWNNEIDIAPETLYSEATNTPLPEWMEE